MRFGTAARCSTPPAGIIFVGGFSYADVLDSAKGWAGTIRCNAKLWEQFTTFYNRQARAAHPETSGAVLLLKWASLSRAITSGTCNTDCLARSFCMQRRHASASLPCLEHLQLPCRPYVLRTEDCSLHVRHLQPGQLPWLLQLLLKRSVKPPGCPAGQTPSAWASATGAS